MYSALIGILEGFVDAVAGWALLGITLVSQIQLGE